MFSLLVACCVCDVRLKINDNSLYFAMDCEKFKTYYLYDTDKQQDVMLKTYCDRVNTYISYNMLLKDKIRNMQAGINSITTDYASLKSALLSEFTNQIYVLEDYNTFYELDKNLIVQSAINNDCTLTEQEDIDYISNEIGSWVDSYNTLIKCNYDSDFSTCISYINNEKEEQPSEPEIDERIDNLNESLIELHDNYIHGIETFYKFVDNTNKMFNTLNTTFSEQIEELNMKIEELSKQEDKPSETPIVEQIIQPIENNKSNYTWCIILTVFICLLYIEQLVIFILMKFCRERIEQFVGANNDVLTDEEKQIYHMK